MTTRKSQRGRWKRVEREMAARLDGVRIPLLGREGSDLDTPVFFPEVKSRKVIGSYLWDEYFAQILAGMETAGETERIPAVVLHRPGMKYDDALVCFRASDYGRLVARILEIYA
jgi:hypothetical protein